MNNRIYHIEFEVITPVSIGAGSENDWVKGVDYVIKDNKVYIIDIDKIAGDGVDINKLSSLFIKNENDGVVKLLGNNLEKYSSHVFPLPALTNNPIKSFYRTQLYGIPVVPGSSIKGALRSILFNHIKDPYENNEEQIFGMKSVPGSNETSMSEGNNLMRFIRVGDVELSKTALLNSKIFNLCLVNSGKWEGGWKHQSRETNSHFKKTGFNTLYECVTPGSKGWGVISFAGEVFSQNTEKMTYVATKEKIMGGGLEYLFQIVNAHTRSYLVKEKAFIETYPAERSDEIVEVIDKLIKMIPEDNSYCLLKMSAGTGFHSITGDWQYDDYVNTGTQLDGKKKYKSRKIIEYQNKLQLMGFVKLRIIPDEDLNTIREIIDEKHNNLLEPLRNILQSKEINHQQEIARKEALRQQIEKEKRIRELQEREQKELQIKSEKYNSLISKANILKDNGQLEEAKKLYSEADVLFPSSCSYLIKDLEERIKKINNQKGSLKDFFTTFKFASPGAFSGNLKKRYRYNESLSIDDELDEIADYVSKELERDQTYLKHWKDKKTMKKAFGDDYSDKLYSLIFGNE